MKFEQYLASILENGRVATLVGFYGVAVTLASTVPKMNKLRHLLPRSPSTIQFSFFSEKVLRELPPPIKLTSRAADRIKSMMIGKENAMGVRISVKRRGCNGYSYVMNYANRDDNDLKKFEVVKNYGVQVFVDPKAIFFLVGTEMDYIENELTAEFTFTNPNSKGKCGCGESFNV